MKRGDLFFKVRGGQNQDMGVDKKWLGQHKDQGSNKRYRGGKKKTCPVYSTLVDFWNCTS